MPELADIRVIRELLERHGFHFSKSLGQNFIVNPTLCPRIAEAGGAAPGVGVLEIGPGVGVLTAALCARAEKVVTVEVDTALLPVLGETLAGYDNVRVVYGDVLKIDLAGLLAEEFPGMPVVVCANLPYYITSPVLMRLLESRLPVEKLTVMVQKEAARRIVAAPGSRACGAITAAIHYYSEPRLLFDVSRGNFLPAPRVDSSVIQLTVRSTPPVRVGDERFFFRVIRAAFGQRRKTLQNALSSGLGFPREKIAAALERAGLPPQSRAEEIDLQAFARLCEALTAQD